MWKARTGISTHRHAQAYDNEAADGCGIAGGASIGGAILAIGGTPSDLAYEDVLDTAEGSRVRRRRLSWLR